MTQHSRNTVPATTKELRKQWTVACVVGEMVGFIPPAVIGATLVALNAAEPVLVAGLVLAGIGEGVILGAAQQRVLARTLPGVTGWVLATGIAAGIAWLAGMGGSSIVGSTGSGALFWVTPLWVIGLLSMGTLQWSRLAAAGLRHTALWIPVTTIAWLIGVTIPVAALSIVPNHWPLSLHVLAAIVGAVLMGAVVGIVTGTALERIARPRLPT